MKKILITGAFGFVGTNISIYLTSKLKYELTALDVFNIDSDCYSAHFSWASLNSLNLDNLNMVIHLAGKAHDTKNTAHKQDYYDINVGLTKQIYDAFLKSKAKKFIFFSSVKAVADTVRGEYLTEEIIPDPHTPYGKSKLEAERYILDQTLPSGKQVYILRPCMIHGPGNKGNLNLLYKLAQRGLPWPLGAFENKRSFTSVGNLQYVIEQLIEKDIAPGIYQMGDDEPLSTNDLIRLMADSVNKKSRIWNVSPACIRSFAKAGDLFRFPLNSERLKKLTESYVVSNEKLIKALGVEKMPYTAVEGMKKTLSSFNGV